MTRGTFSTSQGNSASSCWSIPFFIRKGEKHEKFEGNIVRKFGVVSSVEDKNLMRNRQIDHASKSSPLDLLPTLKKHRLCWSWIGFTTYLF